MFLDMIALKFHLCPVNNYISKTSMDLYTLIHDSRCDNLKTYRMFHHTDVETGSPNEPKMTLNSTRSKIPYNFISRRASISFHLHSTTNHFETMLRKVFWITSKWSWRLQVLLVSPNPKFHFIFVLQPGVFTLRAILRQMQTLTYKIAFTTTSQRYPIYVLLVFSSSKVRFALRLMAFETMH